MNIMARYHMQPVERDPEWNFNESIWKLPKHVEGILNDTPLHPFPICYNVTMNQDVHSDVSIIIPFHREQFFSLWYVV